VCHYYERPLSFEHIAEQVSRNEDGGTLAVHLGLVAVAHGYRARVYSYNVRVFDPTWKHLSRRRLRGKLRARAAAVTDSKLAAALTAYDRFLDLGAEVAFPELTARLLADILDRGHPILTGLSSTYLYQSSRERPEDNEDDDVAGEPVGHFVVITGYTRGGRRFAVNDPSPHAPFGQTGRYHVGADRLLNSILLGVTTYDAVLLELWPAEPDGGKA
jgi:hypothetical protein